MEDRNIATRSRRKDVKVKPEEITDGETHRVAEKELLEADSKDKHNSVAAGAKKSRLHLPSWNGRGECLTYIGLYCLVTAYVTYCVYWESKEYRKGENYKNGPNFHKGRVFTMLEEKQDTKHVLTEVSKQILKAKWASSLIVYITVGRVVEFFTWQHRKWYILTANIIGLAYLGGVVSLIQALVTIFLFYVILLITRRKTIVWIVALTVFTIFNNGQFTVWRHQLYSNHIERMVGFIGFKFQALRCMSYCLSTMSNPSKCFSLPDMIIYSLYFPTVFFGPLMNSNTFFTQLAAPKKQWSMARMLEIIISTLRVCMWIVFLELMQHYLYITAINSDTEFMSTCSLWTLLGLMMWSGAKHHIFHILAFGVGSRAAAFDQIETVAMPRCVLSIAFYSDMWRSFDRAATIFNKEHIYSAAQGNKHGSAWNVLVTLLCFLFAGFVYGRATFTIMIWVILNGIEVLFESFVCNYLRKPDVVSKLQQMYSSRTLRRLQGILGVPFLGMSMLNMYLMLYGKEVTLIHLNRVVFQETVISYVLTFIILYLWVQVSLSSDVWFSYKEGKITSLWYNNIEEVDVYIQRPQVQTEEEIKDKKTT